LEKGWIIFFQCSAMLVVVQLARLHIASITSNCISNSFYTPSHPDSPGGALSAKCAISAWKAGWHTIHPRIPGNILQNRKQKFIIAILLFCGLTSCWPKHVRHIIV